MSRTKYIQLFKTLKPKQGQFQLNNILPQNCTDESYQAQTNIILVDNMV